MTSVHRYTLLTLNFVLHGIHQTLIVFSLVGWIFCETRMLNLIALMLILFSWYGLGAILRKDNAWGYCVITDIQWQVRKKLGLDSRSGGYVKYLADNLLGGDFDETRADKWAVAVILACTLASLTTNLLYGSCPLAAD
ncbi:MAG: DUF2784 family protein [Gammaproteobacteria bacterium]|nr:DUF2784 family protein [Gammaproteobacteria bacterium]